VSSLQEHTVSAKTLSVAPTQWADFKNIQEVEPIDESDLECMTEVRDVLNKHGKRDRFGLALLHRHFAIRDGEVLLEDSNDDTRELTIRPVQKDTADAAVPTIWKLLDEEISPVQRCKNGNHAYTPPAG
jgi:hypothetical protein